MSCTICLKYTGKLTCHNDEGCPLSASLLCRRCHHRGHLASQCTHGCAQWERPTTLEELIPSDIRLRYNITSCTRIPFTNERCTPEAEHELASINTVVIPDDYGQLSEFVKRHKIPVEKTTKAAGNAFIAAIKEWGIKRGLRIVVTVPKKDAGPGIGNSVPIVNEVLVQS